VIVGVYFGLGSAPLDCSAATLGCFELRR
jgi:hypothetical protein